MYFKKCSLPCCQNGDVCISILHPPVDDPQSGELPSERWNPTQNVRLAYTSYLLLTIKLLSIKFENKVTVMHLRGLLILYYKPDKQFLRTSLQSHTNEQNLKPNVGRL